MSYFRNRPCNEGVCSFDLDDAALFAKSLTSRSNLYESLSSSRGKQSSEFVIVSSFVSITISLQAMLSWCTTCVGVARAGKLTAILPNGTRLVFAGQLGRRRVGRVVGALHLVHAGDLALNGRRQKVYSRSMPNRPDLFGLQIPGSSVQRPSLLKGRRTI